MHQVNQQKGQKTYKYIAKKINQKNVNEKPNRCLERDKKNRKNKRFKIFFSTFEFCRKFYEVQEIHNFLQVTLFGELKSIFETRNHSHLS